MISNLKLTVVLILCILFHACGAVNLPTSESQPIDHSEWNELLKKHVDSNGLVNYKGFVGDSLKLNAYLENLSDSAPNREEWSQAEQLAYWINAYNAFTIQLIIRHYPVESIKDIGGFIPRVNSPWDIEFIRIGKEQYDLNNIEHDIIRKHFDEPRIHFALVCAAESCPKLRNEAYTSRKLEDQLHEQAVDFFNNPAKNEINQNELRLSKLLSWYKADFLSDKSSIQSYVQQYVDLQIDPEANIKYKDYSWELNEQ